MKEGNGGQVQCMKDKLTLYPMLETLIKLFSSCYLTAQDVDQINNLVLWCCKRSVYISAEIWGKQVCNCDYYQLEDREVYMSSVSQTLSIINVNIPVMSPIIHNRAA